MKYPEVFCFYSDSGYLIKHSHSRIGVSPNEITAQIECVVITCHPSHAISKKQSNRLISPADEKQICGGPVSARQYIWNLTKPLDFKGPICTWRFKVKLG